MERIYSLRIRLTLASGTTVVGANGRNGITHIDRSACTTTVSTIASTWVVSLFTLSAGPLGEASKEPDIAENGAVTGDTISATSKNAASRPRMLERTVTGVINRTDRCVGPLFKIDAMRGRDFSNETTKFRELARSDR